MSVFDFAKFICGPILPKNENDIVGIFHRKKSPPVEVTASGIYSDGKDDFYRYPRAVIEYNNQNWWTSDDQDPKLIMFNFTNKRILLTNYSVQSLDASKNSPHAKKWITQGYNDKNEWVTIDEVEESKINGPLYIETRGVSNNERPFSAIKITQNGVNWCGTNVLRFYKIDFFGIVEGFGHTINTCRATRRSFNHYLIMIFLTLH